CPVCLFAMVSIHLAYHRGSWRPDSFFFHATATPEISTLSLHDALPICPRRDGVHQQHQRAGRGLPHPPAAGSGRDLPVPRRGGPDRKSTRLNSSHDQISYAVFCLKKKNNKLPRSYAIDRAHPPPQRPRK